MAADLQSIFAAQFSVMGSESLGASEPSLIVNVDHENCVFPDGIEYRECCSDNLLFKDCFKIVELLPAQWMLFERINCHAERGFRSLEIKLRALAVVSLKPGDTRSRSFQKYDLQSSALDRCRKGRAGRRSQPVRDILTAVLLHLIKQFQTGFDQLRRCFSFFDKSANSLVRHVGCGAILVFGDLFQLGFQLGINPRGKGCCGHTGPFCLILTYSVRQIPQKAIRAECPVRMIHQWGGGI